jgi:hypothetical protein
MTLELWNSKSVSGRWLFNPAVTPGKIRASNLQSAKKFSNPQSDPHSAFTLLEKPQTSQISPPLSEGLLQEKSLVNWRPLFVNLFLWKIWIKLSHFTTLLNVWNQYRRMAESH